MLNRGSNLSFNILFIKVLFDFELRLDLCFFREQAYIYGGRRHKFWICASKALTLLSEDSLGIKDPRVIF